VAARVTLVYGTDEFAQVVFVDTGILASKRGTQLKKAVAVAG
jgi:hypothetical protein